VLFWIVEDLLFVDGGGLTGGGSEDGESGDSMYSDGRAVWAFCAGLYNAEMDS